MLAGLWEHTLHEWESRHPPDPRPPVFILVCKNTKIAKIIYEWLAEDSPPAGIPPSQIRGFRNSEDRIYTIRVDSKVVHETDTGESKSDESTWMRFTLDTVGKVAWPQDRQGRTLYPEGFEQLAVKMKRPLHPPPGRDVRCIVSVGMLTEGWDCNTVTHIVGLRPFMSQLLCEQVVGRALRRPSYDVGPNGKLTEETAKVFGVPFEVIPFKETKGVPAPPPAKRHHVHAVPEKSDFEIRFPRVEGYRQAIRNRIAINWDEIAPLQIDPAKIPADVEVKAFLPTNQGRPSLTGPGKLENITLNPFRSGKRLQELSFELARDLTRAYVSQPSCEAPAHVLFPQLARATGRFLREKVTPLAPADRIDVFLSPYYGWAIELLLGAIHPDTSEGEAPEIPLYETNRGAGSTSEVDFWTSRDVREVIHSHLNYMVADTERWEQSAAYFLDTNPRVHSFAKNASLGFAIPYLHNGQSHDYVPDFIVRLADGGTSFLILETTGYDPLKDTKKQAALRWVSAVNSEGTFGHWTYAMVSRPEEVPEALEAAEVELR
jgi:type III restriction enzyme